MTRRAPFTQADVQRMIRAAKAEGYGAPAVDALPDGGLRLLTEPDREEKALDPFEVWERTDGGRAA